MQHLFGNLYRARRLIGGEPHAIIGEFDDSATFTVARTDVEVDVAELKEAWGGISRD